MATPPPLNPPRLGDPISKECSYVKRASAEKQAGYWNLALANDPELDTAPDKVTARLVLRLLRSLGVHTHPNWQHLSPQPGS
jgi:hypothetical protein